MSVSITRRPGRWQVSKQQAPLRGLTGLAENTMKQTTKTMNLALKTIEARATRNETYLRREKKRSRQKALTANGKYIALQLTGYRSPTYPLTCSQVYGNS